MKSATRVPIRRNAVYWVDDKAVNLPPTPPEKRADHENRPFLVVSNDLKNDDAAWPIVMGFPLTTNPDFATEFDIPLNVGDANLPKKSWIQVALFQPLDKAKVLERVGQLDRSVIDACYAQLFGYLDL